jgi:EAL domain-containing protein (putative c-di-GMP-specific phosphodiesterase class I)
VVRNGVMDFCNLVARRFLRPLYQPVVDLATGQPVAVEALARWPELGIGPMEAFAWASELGRLDELDLACRTAAVEDAIAHGMPDGFSLFVNIEPSVLGPGMIEHLLTLSSSGLNIVAEITERSILDRPAELLSNVRDLRAAGCAIALDDVGAVPDSLSLLPFLAPDIVKLDMSLVQQRPVGERAATVTAVSAYAERTGATVLAEGIETKRDLSQALALGATLGQGWHLGRPAPLRQYEPVCRPVPRGPGMPPLPTTPFDLLDPHQLRIGTKDVLLGISHHIEQQGVRLATPPVILSAFQAAASFTAATADRYQHLARRCPLVVALATGLTHEPAPGVRGADLATDDPLRHEWTVVAVGTHYTGALIAKDLGDTGPDLDRRFLFTLTHHHPTVLAAATSLLSRVQPQASKIRI